MAKRKITSGERVFVTMVAEWDDRTVDGTAGAVMMVTPTGEPASVVLPRGTAVAPLNGDVTINGNFLQEERVRKDAARRLETASEVGDAGELRDSLVVAKDPVRDVHFSVPAGMMAMLLREGNVVFTDEGRFQVTGGVLVRSEEPGEIAAFRGHHEKLARSKDETVLEEAGRLITGARRIDYGPVREGFTWVAEFWTTYLRAKGLKRALTPEDVCMLMNLLKVARGMENTKRDEPVKRDTIVDMAGYAGLVDQLNNDGGQQ